MLAAIRPIRKDNLQTSRAAAAVCRFPAASGPSLELQSARRSTLPGGVTTFAQSSGDLWSYPDMHGNSTVTTNASAVQVGPVGVYDPWGAILSTPVGGGNDVVAQNFNAFGADGKVSDPSTGITIMGARPYAAGRGSTR